MAEVWPLALLAAAAWAIGSALLRGFAWPELRRAERASLELTAGLGVVALLLSIAALASWFAHATAILVALVVAGTIVAARAARLKGSRSFETRGSRSFESASSCDEATAGARRLLPSETLIALCALVACVGAIAPVTDYDALSYVLPIARHIAREGTLRVWSDQAPSMWPQAHQVLLAYLIGGGGDRAGALTALEWLIAVGAVSALARRVCERPGHTALAVALAIAAPVTAFQISAAKEDVLLLSATASALFCVAGPMTIGEVAAAGLFAGVAASVKYPGLGVALTVVIWIAIATRSVRHVAAAGAVATLVAGVWYVLNVWRFGNPVAPFVLGANGTPLDATTVRTIMDDFGGGRGIANFFVTPLRIFAEPSLYCGRATLFHPLTYAGAAAVLVPRLRRRNAPLLFAAAVLYIGWYLTMQNARLLLPAAMLLAPAAADVLAPAVKRSRWVAAAIVAAVAAPLLLAPVVGVVRAARYLSDPATYLERETEHYVDIQWANAHLDPARHRILSMFDTVEYFTVPAIGLSPMRQLEFSAADIATHDRLLAACRRRGVTHVFTARHDLADVDSQLRLVYDNPASRLGDVHFFRAPPVEATAIFEILPAR
jgi:hypothetical protein